MNGVAEWAAEQGVPGLLFETAKDIVGREAADRLKALAFTETARHLRTLSVVHRLGATLDAAGADWAVLKGPALVESAYQGTARPYEDLDLLVRPGHFSLALEALEAAGAELVDRNWDLVIGDGRAELHLLDRPTGVPIDLHWHLINRQPLRRTFRIDTDELLSRRTILPTAGFPVLEASDRLMHYAVHAAHSGGHRLIWLADLSLVLRHDPPDWEAVVERCRRWRTGLPVAVMLARTERTLGPALPAGVLAAIVGNPLGRAMVRGLNAWQPGGRLPGGGSVRHGVTESLSGTVPATAGQAWRKFREMLQRLEDPYPHWLDDDDPANVAFDAGDHDGRRRYLESVRASSL
jgi:hypothetical protein